MVHALTEAHRVLRPGGYVIDYRPDADPRGCRAKHLDAFCISRGRELSVGSLVEPSQYYRDYRASDRAVQRILRGGTFTLVSSEIALPRIYFRDLDALKHYLQTEWTGTTLGSQTKQRLARILQRDPEAQIAVIETFRINVLRKA